MINELMQYKWIIGLSLILIVSIVYKIFNRKSKNLKSLEDEYNKILTSEDYKVKGRFEE
jgi:hypothetical protein